MPQSKNNNRGNKNAPKNSVDYIDLVSGNAGSAGDMTGLIPAAHVAGHEIDAYKDLYNHDPAAREKGRKKDFD